MNSFINTYSSDSVREYNKSTIFNLIRREGPISRAGLTKITRMSPTSTGRIVGNLIDEGFVREVGTKEGGLGRRATLVEVNPDGLLAFGINIDVPHIHVGVADLSGDIHTYKSYESPADLDVEKTLDIVVDGILEQFEQLEEKQQGRICGVGVTVPGHVIWQEGILDFSPQLTWDTVPLKMKLQKRLRSESVYLENDVKAAALAEGLYGAAVDASDFVVIRLGSGMGAAVVNNGELLRGKDNIIGELGHMIVEPDGELCDCGRRGCLQTFLCISGIEKRSRRSFRQTLADARAGDETCAAILKQTEQYMAMWTANLRNLYNPQKVLFYGKIFQEWPELIEAVREQTRNFEWNISGDRFTIQLINFRQSKLEAESGDKEVVVQTAASQVFHDMLSNNLPHEQTDRVKPFFSPYGF